MTKSTRWLTIPFLAFALAACGSSSSTNSGSSPTTAASNNSTTSSTAGSTTGGASTSGKDPCVLLTGADAKTLFAATDVPTANKTASPFLSCGYIKGGGPEGLSLAISTTKLTYAKIGAGGTTKDLSGLGDAAFTAGGAGSAVVAWTSGGLTYKLSWLASPTATTGQLIPLAHTIAGRI